MQTIQQNVAAITGVPAREIPVPPGGGSWKFDESSWQWVSNDPTPTPTPETAGDGNATADTPAQEQ